MRKRTASAVAVPLLSLTIVTRCCTWLEDHVAGQRVLDYGSGSGILGLAALSFGAVEVRS